MNIATDKATAGDSVGATVRSQLQDMATHQTSWRIEKFDADIDAPEYRLSVWAQAVRRAKGVLGNLFGVDQWKARWDDCRDYAKFFAEHKPFEVAAIEGNLLLNEGINTMWDLVAGQGSQTNYGNANARLGVGDSTTAESATQTALQAPTNTLFKAMDATFPTTGSSQKITFQSTFGGSDANFAWQEFTADNGSTPNKNLNRKVSNQGTKTNGQTWVLKLEITLS